MPGRNFDKVFEQFTHQRVLVIGDVMVDAYVIGRVDRISPEAPVPVVTVEKRVNRLGGAANVALNLKALGAEPILCSVIGNDLKGKEFLDLLAEEQISSEAVIASGERMTTTKFRVIGNKAQMLRVDEENTSDLSEKDESALLERIFDIIDNSLVHSIIIQDYNKGVLTPRVISKVVDKARVDLIPVSVDPKKKNFMEYKGVTLFKPNLKELREGLGREVRTDDPESVRQAASQLHKEQAINTVLITLSDEGVFISRHHHFDSFTQQFVAAHKRNISDVSGAGDTVISVAALCLTCSLEPVEIAALANLAGGLVCEESGVVPVNRDKLLKEANSML